jgi:hypothetical protein
MSSVPYSSIVGSLMFTMVSTRPYISQVVGVVSQFMVNPGKEHWTTVKWIFRYLRGTLDASIFYRSTDLQIKGFVDFDFGGDKDG